MSGTFCELDTPWLGIGLESKAAMSDSEHGQPPRRKVRYRSLNSTPSLEADFDIYHILTVVLLLFLEFIILTPTKIGARLDCLSEDEHRRA